MTPMQFNQWLADMQSAGLIRSGHGHIQDAADRLGISRERVRQMMRDGTVQIQTDLACQALLAGLQPYPTRTG